MEMKVARMLSHEIDVEKVMQLLNLEAAHSKDDVNRHFRDMHHLHFMNNMYWSRKEKMHMAVR